MTSKPNLVERLIHARKQGAGYRQLFDDCIAVLSIPLPEDVAELAASWKRSGDDAEARGYHHDAKRCRDTADMLESLQQRIKGLETTVENDTKFKEGYYHRAIQAEQQHDDLLRVMKAQAALLEENRQRIEELERAEQQLHGLCQWASGRLFEEGFEADADKILAALENPI